jgi:uncharacterized membrane protein (DUF106 family)
MDLALIIQANPKTTIVVLSFIATLFITIITHFLTDKELMRTIKQKQKALREEMKKFRDNPEKMMEINKKMMEDFPHQMKQSMKVSLVTIIPLLLLFNWLRTIYSTTAIAGSWIWWYIIASLIFSLILRKVFKLD